MSSIAVVGAGSVGVYFAAHLSAVGNDVVACVRRPFDRYRVDSAEAPFEGPATVAIDPSDIAEPATWVLLTVKAHQTEGAAPWLRALCGADTTVVVVQNGVEGAERARPFTGAATVLPAVVYCGSELVEPGHIEHHARGTIFTPDVPIAHELAKLFAASKAELLPTPTFLEEAWKKLATNTIANGITALTLRDFAVMGSAGMTELAYAIGAEAYAVGRAEGADLSDEQLRAFTAAMGKMRGGGTSMLYDRRAGRPLEHDALYGAVLRTAARHGIAVPLHQAFNTLLAAIN